MRRTDGNLSPRAIKIQPKICEINPSWIDVKRKITVFDKPGLIQLVSDLYAINSVNRDFLHVGVGRGAEPLASYKLSISVALVRRIKDKLWMLEQTLRYGLVAPTQIRIARSDVADTRSTRQEKLTENA
jgi:hypothetical protein